MKYAKKHKALIKSFYQCFHKCDHLSGENLCHLMSNKLSDILSYNCRDQFISKIALPSKLRSRPLSFLQMFISSDDL